MKIMHVAVLVFGLVGFVGSAMATDPSGTWKSTCVFDDQTIEGTLKLWLDTEGSVLGGQYSDGQNRRGLPVTPAIFKYEDGKVGFAVMHDFNSQKILVKYAGRLSGDLIVGQSSIESAEVKQTATWVARRQR